MIKQTEKESRGGRITRGRRYQARFKERNRATTLLLTELVSAPY